MSELMREALRRYQRERFFEQARAQMKTMGDKIGVHSEEDIVNWFARFAARWLRKKPNAEHLCRLIYDRRIVLDTNIYVSALRYGGKPKQVLDYAQSGNSKLLISAPLMLELVRVLRDKFGFTASRIAGSIEILWRDAEWIEPARRLDLCPMNPTIAFWNAPSKGRPISSLLATGICSICR